ncbi:hypothetical protein ACHQM5_014053 [Ranunculus cassubicifolius]
MRRNQIRRENEVIIAAMSCSAKCVGIELKNVHWHIAKCVIKEGRKLTDKAPSNHELNCEEVRAHLRRNKRVLRMFTLPPPPIGLSSQKNLLPKGFQNHPELLYPRMMNRGWNGLVYTRDSEYDETAVRRFYGRLHEMESGSLMWRRASGEDVVISPDTIEQALHLVEPPSRAQQFHHADENIKMLAGRLILRPENPNVSPFPAHQIDRVRIGSMRGNQQVVAFWYNTNIHPSKKPTDVFIPCLHVLDVLQNNKPNFSIAQDIALTIKLGWEKRRCLLPMVVTEWMRSWKELDQRASGTWKKVKNWAESSTLDETRALPAWSAVERTRWQEHSDELAQQAAHIGIPDGGDDPLDPDQVEIDSKRRILTALGHVRTHITSRADQTDARIQAVAEKVAALEQALTVDRASLLTGIRELFQNMVQGLACGSNSRV